MSSQLARRTGTVGALVAAAGMTMVAGCWPALAAEAPELRPGRVGTAPGQERKAAQPVEVPVEEAAVAEPVVADPVVEEPVVAEPVVEQPVAEAEPVVAEPVVEEPAAVAEDTAPAAGPGKSGAAPGQAKKEPAAPEPVAEQPAPVAGDPVAAPVEEPVAEQQAPGQAKKQPVPAPVGSSKPVVGPPTGVDAAPAPVPAKKADREQAPAEPPARERPVAGPVAEAPAAESPAVAGPREQRPAAGPPTHAAGAPARPAAPEVLGPAVPPSVPESAVLATGPTVPSAVQAATAARRARGSAADAWPLRPLGSGGAMPRTAAAPAQPAAAPALRRPQRDPVSMPVDLGTALPALATGTVEAVATRPQIPAGIVAVVVVFLLLQSRIDRRDPKLAAARFEEDAPLDFTPAEIVLSARQPVAVS